MSNYLIVVFTEAKDLHSLDKDVAGFYVFRGINGSDAMDRFHQKIPIKCLDDFRISVVTELEGDLNAREFNCKVDIRLPNGDVLTNGDELFDRVDSETERIKPAEGHCQDIW